MAYDSAKPNKIPLKEEEVAGCHYPSLKSVEEEKDDEAQVRDLSLLLLLERASERRHARIQKEEAFSRNSICLASELSLVYL